MLRVLRGWARVSRAWLGGHSVSKTDEDFGEAHCPEVELLHHHLRLICVQTFRGGNTTRVPPLASGSFYAGMSQISLD